MVIFYTRAKSLADFRTTEPHSRELLREGRQHLAQKIIVGDFYTTHCSACAAGALLAIQDGLLTELDAEFRIRGRRYMVVQGVLTRIR